MAYACVVEVTGKRQEHFVPLDELYLLIDEEGHREPVTSADFDLNHTEALVVDNKKKYVRQVDKVLRRVYVIGVAESKSAMILKRKKFSGRIVLPARKSVGETVFSIDKFIRREEKVSLKLQKTDPFKATVIAQRKDAIAKLRQPKQLEHEKEESVERKKNEQASKKLGNASANGSGGNLKDNEELSSTKKPQPSNKESSKLGSKTADKDEQGKKRALSSPSDSSVDEVTSFANVTAKTNTTPVKTDHPAAKRSKHGDPEEGVNIMNESVDSLRMENKELKEMLSSQATIITKINENVDSIQKENKELKEMVSSQATIITKINENVENLCKALLSPFEEPASSRSTSSQQRHHGKCQISQTFSVAKDDTDFQADEDMIYIGRGQYIFKSKLVHAERGTTYEKRLARVVRLIWPKGDAKNWNLHGKDRANNAKKKVEDFHVDAIHNLLLLMSWKKIGPKLRPVVVGKNTLEPLTLEYTRRAVGKYLSKLGLGQAACSDSEEDDKEKDKNKTADGKATKSGEAIEINDEQADDKEEKDGKEEKEDKEEEEGEEVGEVQDDEELLVPAVLMYESGDENEGDRSILDLR